jgi:hypothetical protein
LGWGSFHAFWHSAHCVRDRLEHTVHVANHVIVPESDHGEPFALKIPFSLQVGRCRCVVAVAIKLDHEPVFRGEEIDDVRSYDMLPAKLAPAYLSIS